MSEPLPSTTSSSALAVVAPSFRDLALSLQVPCAANHLPPELKETLERNNQALLVTQGQMLDMAHQTNAVALRGFHQMLTQGISVLSHRIAGTEFKVGQVESKVDLLRHDFNGSVEALQRQVDHFKQGLDEVKQAVQSSQEASDRLRVMWDTEPMQPLRQLTGLIGRMGLDTRNELGMCPLIAFAFKPKGGQSPEDHLTILYRPLCKLLQFQQEQFVDEILASQLAARLDRALNTLGEPLTQISPEQLKEYECLFPIRPVKQHQNIMVFKTLHFARMVAQEHRTHQMQGRGIFRFGADLGLVSTTERRMKGQFVIAAPRVSRGSGPIRFTQDDIEYRGKALPFQPERADNPAELSAWLRRRLGEDPARARIELLRRLRYFNRPAAAEYILDPAVHMGVCLFRQALYGPEAPTPPLGTLFHVGEYWNVVPEAPIPFYRLMRPEDPVGFEKELRDLLGCPILAPRPRPVYRFVPGSLKRKELDLSGMSEKEIAGLPRMPPRPKNNKDKQEVASKRPKSGKRPKYTLPFGGVGDAYYISKLLNGYHIKFRRSGVWVNSFVPFYVKLERLKGPSMVVPARAKDIRQASLELGASTEMINGELQRLGFEI